MIKESRNISLFVGVRMPGISYRTPHGLASRLAWDMYRSIRAKYRERTGKHMTSARQIALRQRAYRRIYPTCKWIMQRK